MGRVLMDGFELGYPESASASHTWEKGLWQKVQTVSDSGSIVGCVTSSKASGNYSMRMYTYFSTNRRFQLYQDLNPITEHYGRIMMRSNRNDATRYNIHLQDALGGVVAQIAHSVSADMVSSHLYVGNTLVASYSNSHALGTWVRLEWRLKIDGVNGVFTYRRNGDELMHYTGNTDPTGSGNFTRFSLGTSLSTNISQDSYFDDVAVNDTTGTVNNSWVGPGSILLLKPKGAGNYTQFTPDSGNNFARVNEIPHTSDSAYVESDTADEIDTYEMQTLADLGVDISDPSFNIKAVQYLVTGRWDEAETELSPVLRLGTTDEVAAAVALSNVYYRYWDWMMDVNPFDSLPWEPADLNALEAGIKHIVWSGP